MTVMTQTTVPEWTLGWRLQRSLAHAGMDIEDMAKEIGVSRQTISRWINERSDPRLGYLKLWALRTGVPIEWLLTGGVISLRIQTPAPGSAAAA
jgi:transcriptional regulator with XRE-family HTH domain